MLGNVVGATLTLILVLVSSADFPGSGSSSYLRYYSLSQGLTLAPVLGFIFGFAGGWVGSVVTRRQSASAL